MTAKTITEIFTAAGITKTSAALEAVYTAMQLGTQGSLSDIMEVAGTKDTATRVALAELVTKGLVVRADGTGIGKNRTPNTYSLPVATKKAPKAPKTQSDDAPKTDDARYGKAMIRVWDFMKSHKGEELKVSEIVSGLAEQGENTWYNATNQACKALAARSTGVTQVADAKVNTYVYND